MFLIADFFLMGAYDYLVAPFSVVYVGILGLYAGTKEFDRWYKFHESRHPGEIFIIIWTVVIFALVALSFVLGKDYKISPEAIADYIMVLSVFALTQKSKRLYEERRRKKS